MADQPDDIQVPTVTGGQGRRAPAAGGAPPQIEGYRVTTPLGRGGMGTVWRAVQLSTQREVALKVMSLGAFASDKVRTRFEREVELTARLEHRHIARIYDSGVRRGAYYYAMELVDGVDLKQYVTDQGLSQRQALGLMSDVCQAVQHAHQRGVIHRDLKLSNILVTADGQPHVLDFGLAKAFQEEAKGVTVSMAGEATGTPAYMSPEQAAGRLDETDTRSDVYSLGLILYQLLTGRSAHDLSGTRYDVLRRITGQDIRRPRAASKAVDRELEAVLLKALASDPADRYASAGGLAGDITNYLTGEPLTARKPTTAYFLRKRIAKYRVPVGIAAAVVALLIGMAVWSYLRVRWERDRATTAEKETANQRDVARLAQKDSEAARQDSEAAGRQEARQRELAEQQRKAAETQQRIAEQQRGIAQQQRDRAEQRERTSRRLLYAAHMNLAMRAWENGNAPVTHRLLARHGPLPGREDLRSFDWYYLWRLCHSEKVKVLLGRFRLAAFSRDGRTLATWGQGRVSLWDVATGKPRAGLRGVPENVLAMEFLADGSTLATAAADGWVRLWDLAGLTERSRLRLAGFRGPVRFAAIDSAGTLVATGGVGPVVRVWDLAANKERLTVTSSLEGEGRAVCCAAFSPDGRTLATGGGCLFAESEVKLWDLQTGREKLALKGHTGQVYAIVFSPDGKTVITSASDSTIRLWDAATGQGKACLRGHTHEVHGLALSSDGRVLASAGADLTVRLWDVHTAECLATLGGHEQGVNRVALAPNGKALASVGSNNVTRLWNLSGGLGPAVLKGHQGEVRRVVFSPDGKKVATGSLDSTIKLWDAATGRELATLRGHTDKVEGLEFAPDGKKLATCSEDSTVRLWDIATGRPQTILEGRHVMSVAFSPDSNLLAMGMGYWRRPAPSEVKIWNLRTGKEQATLSGHRSPIQAMAFSPDGTKLASAGWDGTAILWDVATGTKILTLKGHQARLTMTAFSPDGKVLATVSWDRTVRLWDAATGRLLSILAGHRAGLYGAAFSPDGRTLATAGWDGLVKLWDVTTGQERATLKAHTRPVWAVAFSPDGRTLATGSGDGTAKLFRGATDDEVALSNLPDRVRRIAIVDPGAQGRIVSELKAYLVARAAGGLTLADVNLAMSAASSLEKARKDALAAEAFRSFGGVIARDKDRTLAQRAEVFAGSARRLGLVGKPMTLEGTPVDGKPFDWSAYRGKVVLVYFWATVCRSGTMCSACRTELADIRKHYQLYHGRGFDVVGISNDRDRKALEAFLQRQPLPWTTLHEADASGPQPMTLRYGVRARSSLLVGKDGKVVSLRTGGGELGRLLGRLIGPAEAPGERQ